MLQPSAFLGLVGDKRSVGRGLLARFLFCQPEPIREQREELPISSTVAEAYKQAVQDFLELPKQTLTLTDEARSCFLAWRESAREKRFDEWAVLADYEIPAKLVSNLARVAGLLALIEKEDKITAKCMRNAIALIDYFAGHMLMALSPTRALSKGAEDLLKRLRVQAITEESKLRQTIRKVKVFQEANAVDRALLELIQKGHIRRYLVGSATKGKAVIEVHPSLLQKSEVETI